MNWYIWRRLVRDTTRPGRRRRIGTVILLALSLQMVASVVGTRVLAHSYERIFAWTGYVWLALLFYLLVFLLALELPRAAAGQWLLRRRYRQELWWSPDRWTSARRSSMPYPRRPPDTACRTRPGGCSWPGRRRSSAAWAPPPSP